MREENWVMGTIFRLFGRETVGVVVKADAPGLTLAGWCGSRFCSAKCKDTTYKVWRVMGSWCLPHL